MLFQKNCAILIKKKEQKKVALMPKKFRTEDINSWKDTVFAGEEILLSGTLYTARDAAHKRILAAIREEKPLPFPLENAIIYYAGPTPPTNGLPAGSFGPTTSSRMDPYLPLLTEMGLSATIGKGDRSDAVYASLKENKAIYLAAIGGAGALYARSVKSISVIAFEDLGCESVKRIEIEDFPVYVAIDTKGNSIFKR